MKWPGECVEATFLRRYKRFFADFRLADGTVVTGHCANTGSMTTCLAEEAPAWITDHAGEKRKLRYSWQAIRCEDGWVGVNTGLANKLVRECLEAKAVPELAAYPHLRQEQAYGKNSRVDLLLEGNGLPACYIEVKNVTLLLGPGKVGFPDAVTQRGTKHLVELVERIHAGDRAVLFYCVQRESAAELVTSGAFDPEYARTLAWAMGEGLSVFAWRAELSRSGLRLTTRLPIRVETPTGSILASP